MRKSSKFVSLPTRFLLMRRIGLLSDTHGTLNPGVLNFLLGADEIWHAGDIGDIRIFDQIKEIKPLKAVSGNIDGREIRLVCPVELVFSVEKVRVSMTHIGGYPGGYDRRARELIEKERPKLFVCGHSHILKIMYDKKYEMLAVNPGAAGNFGFHRSVTAVRFVIDGTDIREMEVLDIPRR
jgi:uncharacterized protein